ncbi:MAG: penicillin-binding protein 1C [Bacteroidales bacterium]|nr:penicillin-binding protein 1C [Bacteroidales bacterium]
MQGKAKNITIIAMTLAAIAAAVAFALPKYPFSVPYSTVITDSSGVLLGAHIAEDGQWRFPDADSVPYKFAQCITTYEDKRFYHHGGIDLMAIARAIYQDISQMRIVSGGSTITMQTVRISHNRERTIWAKISEAFQALRLECRYSKDEILLMYASHAPFGGNTVGLETAAQRYFGRPARTLSWAESATLAVLPNNPALIHLSRNREALMLKRNALLQKLLDNGTISEETCLLAQQEPLPMAPRPYPQTAPHLLAHVSALQKKKDSRRYIKTTICAATQARAQNILDRHISNLRANGIQNAAVLIMEVRSGRVVTYIGNTKPVKGREQLDGNSVDIIQAPRSTGSILKPFLYCAMLSEGLMLPNTLVADVPTQISGYMPKNYRLTYDGAVPASRALARSLNVPAVKMLQQYSAEKLIHILQKTGISSVNKSAEHYGLSLILGGCEASLWQLCGAYASMARSLYFYTSHGNMYMAQCYTPPVCTVQENNPGADTAATDHSILSASAIYHTLNALTTVERPENETSHELFGSNRTVAWKTGTSFGFRDAWAIGISGNYVVGVWAGNADGEGRPGLVGITAAAPILFDIMKILPNHGDKFPVPYDELIRATICKNSGHLATDMCPETMEQLIPAAGINSSPCPYCRLIHLDAGGTYRVTADCEDPNSIIHTKWFALPPAMEYYYRQHNSNYKPLPPMKNGAHITDGDSPIQVIYPEEGAKIFLPKGLDGKRQALVIEASSRNSGDKLFWHLDQDFVTSTEDMHRISVMPEPGKHTITITNRQGLSTSLHIEIK